MGALIILGPGSTQISPDRGPVASPSIDEYSDLGGRDIGIGHHRRSQDLPVQFLIHSRAYRPGVEVGDSHDQIVKHRWTKRVGIVQSISRHAVLIETTVGV